MRPADYSEEQIIEAGKALLEAGKRVTPFGIRERMGGGQPKRIRAVWEQYVAGDPEQEARQEAALELPAEIEEQVQGMNTALINDLTVLAKRLYRRADEIAESRTREAVQAARKTRESAETDVAEAERLIEEQDARIEALEGQIAALREELSGAKRENRRLEKEKGDEIASLSVENTRLGEQVKMAQAQAQAAQEARDTAVAERERDRTAQERERATAEQELARERTERKEADQRAAERETQNVRLEERVNAAEKWTGELKAQFEGLQEKLTTAVEQATKPRPTRKKAPAP
jgi:colicin import membrane protein